MSGFVVIVLISALILLCFSIPYIYVQGKKHSYRSIEDGEYHGPDVIGLPMTLLILLIIVNFVLYHKLDNSDNFTYVPFEINSENYSERLSLEFLELEKYRKYETLEIKKEDNTIQLEKVSVSKNPIFLSAYHNQFYFYIKLEGHRKNVYLDFDEKYVFYHNGKNNLEIVINENNEFKVEGTIKKFNNEFINWYYGDATEKNIKVYMPEINVAK